MATTAKVMIQQVRQAHGESIQLRSFFNPLSDAVFHVEIDDGNGAVGYGDGFSEGEALQKAYSECLERRHFQTLDAAIGYPGMASHPDRQQAEANARFELIERDVFLTTYLAKRPPCWLACHQTEPALPSSYSQLIQQLAAFGFSVRLGIVGTCDGAVVSVAALQEGGPTQRFGHSIHPAADSDWKAAIRKSLLSAARSAGIIQTKFELGEKAFRDVEIFSLSSPSEHRDYHLNPANVDKFSWYFSSVEDVVVLPPLEVTLTSLQAPTPHAWTQYIAMASSTGAQTYFTGFNRNRIHHERVGLLAGSELNMEPHPLA
jgi:hypothetical protein